ncbi:MAG: nitrous oxide-stimulated promoter family protein [bacterium]|nr:nitrous oxide-stimulated promoter family protein [bacterium]
MVSLFLRQPTSDEKIRKDIHVLADLTRIYCRQKHTARPRRALAVKGSLTDYARELDVHVCSQCCKLILHGAVMRIRCPMDPKPECKYCPDHCYHPKYRRQVREVMRFAWRHMLKRGRFDIILKHL